MNDCRSGCATTSFGSRRTGVVRIIASTMAATTCSTATAANASHGACTAMSRLASAGPAACMTAGRSTPSMPFAASSCPGGRIAGSHAEYAG